MSLAISEERFDELAREEIRAAVERERPRIVAEIARSCELLDEDAGIAMLPIRGKDPRRTFRRLMREHGVHYVSIGSFKWWKRAAIERLIDEHSVGGTSKCRLQTWLRQQTPNAQHRTSNVEFQREAA